MPTRRELPNAVSASTRLAVTGSEVRALAARQASLSASMPSIKAQSHKARHALAAALAAAPPRVPTGYDARDVDDWSSLLPPVFPSVTTASPQSQRAALLASLPTVDEASMLDQDFAQPPLANDESGASADDETPPSCSVSVTGGGGGVGGTAAHHFIAIGRASGVVDLFRANGSGAAITTARSAAFTCQLFDTTDASVNAGNSAPAALPADSAPLQSVLDSHDSLNWSDALVFSSQAAPLMPPTLVAPSCTDDWAANVEDRGLLIVAAGVATRRRGSSDLLPSPVTVIRVVHVTHEALTLGGRFTLGARGDFSVSPPGVDAEAVARPSWVASATLPAGRRVVTLKVSADARYVAAFDDEANLHVFSIPACGPRPTPPAVAALNGAQTAFEEFLKSTGAPEAARASLQIDDGDDLDELRLGAAAARASGAASALAVARAAVRALPVDLVQVLFATVPSADASAALDGIAALGASPLSPAKPPPSTEAAVAPTPAPDTKKGPLSKPSTAPPTPPTPQPIPAAAPAPPPLNPATLLFDFHFIKPARYDTEAIIARWRAPADAPQASAGALAAVFRWELGGAAGGLKALQSTSIVPLPSPLTSSACGFSASHNGLVLTADDSGIRLWTPSRGPAPFLGALVSRCALGRARASTAALALSADSRWALAGTTDGRILVWDIDAALRSNGAVAADEGRGPSSAVVPPPAGLGLFDGTALYGGTAPLRLAFWDGVHAVNKIDTFPSAPEWAVAEVELPFADELRSPEAAGALDDSSAIPTAPEVVGYEENYERSSDAAPSLSLPEVASVISASRPSSAAALSRPPSAKVASRPSSAAAASSRPPTASSQKRPASAVIDSSAPAPPVARTRARALHILDISAGAFVCSVPLNLGDAWALTDAALIILRRGPGAAMPTTFPLAALISAGYSAVGAALRSSDVGGFNDESLQQQQLESRGGVGSRGSSVGSPGSPGRRILGRQPPHDAPGALASARVAALNRAAAADLRDAEALNAALIAAAAAPLHVRRAATSSDAMRATLGGMQLPVDAAAEAHISRVLSSTLGASRKLLSRASFSLPFSHGSGGVLGAQAPPPASRSSSAPRGSSALMYTATARLRAGLEKRPEALARSFGTHLSPRLDGTGSRSPSPRVGTAPRELVWGIDVASTARAAVRPRAPNAEVPGARLPRETVQSSGKWWPGPGGAGGSVSRARDAELNSSWREARSAARALSAEAAWLPPSARKSARSGAFAVTVSGDSALFSSQPMASTDDVFDSYLKNRDVRDSRIYATLQRRL